MLFYQVDWLVRLPKYRSPCKKSALFNNMTLNMVLNHFQILWDKGLLKLSYATLLTGVY